MSDFVPDDMLTVEIDAREEISLHEDAPEDPIYIRGAYFVNAPAGTSKEDKLIDFFVLDTNFKVIFSRRRHEEGIFRFNTTQKGSYSFVFSNMKDRVNKKQVTLALHPGYDAKTANKKDEKEKSENQEMAAAAGVEIEEVKKLSGQIRKIYKNVRNLMVESKMSMVR